MRPREVQGLVFMPYLEGERTPPLPDAKGQLVGLTLRNFAPANVARAAIEGVLWSLAYGVEVLREQTGTIGRVVLTGGASQSEAVRTDRLGRLRTAHRRHRGVRERRRWGGAAGRLGADRGAADWPIPVLSDRDPTESDLRAAAAIDERYRTVLAAHFGR